MTLDLKKHKDDLLFLPLGGANEIGMNLNLYHLNGKWLMVDLGVGFASNVPGVDMLTPNINFIKNNKKNLLGIVLTHIHEDHLGAVQYLWEDLQVPIYASPLASNFLLAKLSEFKLDRKVEIHIIKPNENLNIGPFSIEFIGLTHSVPEMKALIINNSVGKILHTGDWKFDPDPVVGEVSDKARIAELGNNNDILAVICDSTNALSEGHSRSEGELYDSIKSLIVGRKGLVGVTTFASNIARIYTIAKIAKEVGRKVVLLGYALHRICEVGKKSGYFDQDFDFISDRQMKSFKKDEILVLCTGCQGEAMASARKIATDNHPSVRFHKGDLMIFSSKIIPGNEKKIFELFDLMAKKQIDVITEKDHFVHVSGHPSQQELAELYRLAKPKIAIPVHGEFLHTKAHCEIALANGVEKVLQTENGLVIRITKDGCEKIGFVESGYLAVDGKQLVDLNSDILRERRKIAETGIIIIALTINEKLRINGDIAIRSVGCYDFKKEEDVLIDLQKEIRKIVNEKLKILEKTLGTEEEQGSIFNLSFLKKKNPKKAKKLNSGKINEEIAKTIRGRVIKIIEQLKGKRPAVEVFINFTNNY